jgi:hypothetical protein
LTSQGFDWDARPISSKGAPFTRAAWGERKFTVVLGGDVLDPDILSKRAASVEMMERT